ncbi:GNAT family N-acetyltransferase [Streptomyces sp. NP-1717]|uniref:GNAT family N-acetyltransferase n=1 Tax=unclassified Streptomyces TaxID=2593676 RepID=UPI001F5E25E8|nr:GNAT family N-acetyltransferase [Streptomyces sp. NP-1717]MCI3225957.1 GNAT family N-acetyltransferase [Streptomyces sp. NP-1717]WTA74453.1 GNAT family N-acetyltransferase [Streptomyces sp. NBC_00838]
MKVEQVMWDDTDAVALRARQRAEIAERYGTPDSEPGVPPSQADMAVFFVAYEDDGTAVGCGGLRALGAGIGEIKRMYVAPASRGSGVAPRVLAALEEWAREQGWSSLRLETGDAQPDAVRFYTRSGYGPIPAFGAYAESDNSLCFERPL